MAHSAFEEYLTAPKQTFALVFSGLAPGFLDPSHIKCYVDEVELGILGGSLDLQVTGLATILDYTTSAGETIKFRRITPIVVPVTDFNNGSPIDEKDLDSVVAQMLYAVQENVDGYRDEAQFDHLNMGGNRVVNMGAAVNDYDAVTKAFAQQLVSEGLTGVIVPAVYYRAVYMRSVTQPTAPVGNDYPGWSDLQPAGSDPLWESSTYFNSSFEIADGHSWSEPIRKDGIQGIQGEAGIDGLDGDGRTTYFHVKYADDADGTNMNEIGGLYIGTYSDFEVSDSVDPLDYHWVLFQGAQGPAGTDGIPGINGVDGTTYYLHIKYSNDGGTSFTGNNGEDSGSWIGVYTDDVLEDSIVLTDYQWSVIKGDKGDKGDTGETGLQGDTGLTGPTGATGSGLIYRGQWNDSVTYYHDDVRRDVVEYGGNYYAVVTTHLGQLPTLGSYWVVIPNFGVIATDLLLTVDATVLKDLIIGSDVGGGHLENCSVRSGMSDSNTGLGFFIGRESSLPIASFKGGNNTSLRIDSTGSTFTGTVVIGAGSSGIENMDDIGNVYVNTETFPTVMSATVSRTGSSFTKHSGTNDWGDAQAYSQFACTGGCRLSFKPGKAGMLSMVGLNVDPATNADYSSIDHAIFANYNDLIYVYENGVNQHITSFAYTTDTLLEIVYDNTDVIYYADGVEFFRTTVGAGRTFYMDSAFRYVGDKITHVKFEQYADVTDYEATETFPTVMSATMSRTGNTFEKTSGVDAWDAQVYSQQSFIGGARVSYKAGKLGQSYMMGLNTDPATNTSYSSIDFAFFQTPTSEVHIYESGASAGKYANSMTTDALFDIIYDGQYVKYYIDGVEVKSVYAGLNKKFYMDSSFYNVGAKVTHLKFEPYADTTKTVIENGLITTGQIKSENANGLVIDFDLATMTVGSAAGLTINSGGGLTVLGKRGIVISNGGSLEIDGGGDIRLISTTDDASAIYFSDQASAYTDVMIGYKLLNRTDEFCIQPIVDNTKRLYLGDNNNTWGLIRAITHTTAFHADSDFEVTASNSIRLLRPAGGEISIANNQVTIDGGLVVSSLPVISDATAKSWYSSQLAAGKLIWFCNSGQYNRPQAMWVNSLGHTRIVYFNEYGV